MHMIERWGYKLVRRTTFQYSMLIAESAKLTPRTPGMRWDGAATQQAECPTDKSVRAGRAAMAHSVMIHDASYTGVLELAGPSDTIRAVLDAVVDPAGCRPAAQR